MGERAKSRPSSLGQKSLRTTPLGLKTKMIRCLRFCWLAKARLGRFRTNGMAAALRPRSRMNWRRVRAVRDMGTPGDGRIFESSKGDWGLHESMATVKDYFAAAAGLPGDPDGPGGSGGGWEASV